MADPFPSGTNMTHRMMRLGLAVFLAASMAACAKAETPKVRLHGVWRSQGYGLVAQFGKEKVRLIEQTPVSCLAIGEYSRKRFLAEYAVRPNQENGNFTVHNDGTLSTISFAHLKAGGLDRLCPQGIIGHDDDPVLNFEVLWHTFEQHYAFFATRHVDWNAVYAAFRPRVDGNTTRKELGKIFAAMLQRIGDAHVTLYVDDGNVVSVPSRLETRVLAECRKQRRDNCNPDKYLDERYTAVNKLIRTKYLGNRFKTAFDNAVVWGRIGESTGYFRIDSMAGLAINGSSSIDDIKALAPVLDRVMRDLGRLPKMIVDIRFNGGGDDAVAAAIAGRFTGVQRVFGSKRAYENGRRTPPTDLVVKPVNGPRFQGRVALLTSSETASAAEVFTLAMRVLPQVTLVGEATMGILSDELDRLLPNGWTFSLSNEIYLTPDNELFEETGIPPDVVSPFMPLEDQQRGVDGTIETAISILTNERRTTGRKASGAIPTKSPQH